MADSQPPSPAQPEIERIFGEVCGLQASEREAYLANSGAAPEVVAEVRSLLEFTSPDGEVLAKRVLSAANLLPGRHTYAGSRVGAYRVAELLGEGGMGSVYSASREDNEFDQQVAVKFLRPDLGEDFHERFRRERQILARLSHPHIARILDGGTTAGGIPYFVMEYIGGQAITAYCRERQSSVLEILDLFVEICSAVAYAHQRSIVHRDIKPRNILVTTDGIVKLLDFGIAKSLPEAEKHRDLTSAGLVIGSLDYLSPEQARGAAVDARSDVFSLGAVLYELLSGSKPFAGDTRSDVIAGILTKEPPTLARRHPGVPRALETVVSRALRKKPEERYGSAGEMLADLKAVQLELAQKIRTKPRWRRRAAWAAAFLLVAMGTAAVWLAPRTGGGSPLQIRQITTVGDAWTSAITPDGKYIVYVNVAGEIWVRQVAAPSGMRIQASPNLIWGLRVSPDGNYVHYTASNAITYRVPILGGAAQQGPDLGNRLAFSPDGTRVAASPVREGRATLTVSNIDGQRVRQLASVDEKDGGGLVAPDWLSNDELAYARQEHGRWEVWAQPASGGTGRRLAVTAFDRIYDLATMPSGNVVLDAGAPEVSAGLRQLWLLRKGRLERLTNDLHEYKQPTVTASGDVSALMVTPQATLWSGPLSGPLRQITKGTGLYTSVTWIPGGGLAASVRAGTSREIWAMNADGSGARQILATTDPVGMVYACPDGRTLIFTRTVKGSSAIWRMDTDGQHAAPLSPGPDDGIASCAPDGRNYYFFGNRQVCGGPVAGGQVACFERVPETAPVASPDGKWLAYAVQQEVNGREVGKTRLRPLDGGAEMRTLDFPWATLTRWTPDSKALLMVRGLDREVWRQPIDGSEARQVSHFQMPGIIRFAVSADGKNVAVVNNTPSADVVVLSGIK
jgi:Tol biopolymer transport system component